MEDITFYTYQESFDILLDEVKKKKSFLRLNDGEMRIICGHRCATWFQELDKNLQNDLINISKYKNDKLIKCIGKYDIKKKPWYFEYILKNINIKNKFLDGQFSRMMGRVNGNLNEFWVNKSICYVGSFYEISSKFFDIKEKINNLMIESNINKKLNRKKDKEFVLKKIKEDNIVNLYLKSIIEEIDENELINNSINSSISLIREILSIKDYKYYLKMFLINFYRNSIVSKYRIIDSIESIKLKKNLNNLLNNASSIDYIKTNYRNSYNQLDEIEKKCKEKDKNTLFIISSGPMGKVLIHRLFIKGYQCIDLGHI